MNFRYPITPLEKEEFERFVRSLLISQGISRKHFAVEPFQKSGSISVGSADNYYNFLDAQNSDYTQFKRDTWFFCNLWLNPYFSAYTSGTSVATAYLVTHDKDFNPISLEVDKRSAVGAADGSFVSRLYFEDIFITGIRAAHDNANATYKLPFFLSGWKVSVR